MRHPCHVPRRDAGLYPLVRTRGRDAHPVSLVRCRTSPAAAPFFHVPVITREPADYSSAISSMQQRAPTNACALPKHIRVAS